MQPDEFPEGKFSEGKFPEGKRPPRTDEERENERYIKSLVDPRTEYLPWYAYVAMGVCGVAFTVYLHHHLTTMEAAGKAVVLPDIVQAIYNVLGKWGVVGCTGALSLFITSMGMYSGIFPDKEPTDQSGPRF